VEHVHSKAKSMLLVERHLPDFAELHVGGHEAIAANLIARSRFARQWHVEIVECRRWIFEQVVHAIATVVYDVKVATGSRTQNFGDSGKLPVGRKAETRAAIDWELARPTGDTRELPAADNRVQCLS